MKRYIIRQEVTFREDAFTLRRQSKVVSVIEENPNGEWVRWEDVEKLRVYLENQIPEKRLARLEKALGLVSDGRCPECEQKTLGYSAPQGLFAPEAWETLRENGIDPATGHRCGCSLAKKIR